MYDRRVVHSNLERLAPQLDQICRCITGDQVEAESLMNETLSVLCLNSQGRTLGSAHISNRELFKQSFEVLARLLRRRKQAYIKQSSAFYQLSLFERLLLLFKYRVGFKDFEISEVLQLDAKNYQDFLVQAKTKLKQNGRLEIEPINN